MTARRFAAAVVLCALAASVELSAPVQAQTSAPKTYAFEGSAQARHVTVRVSYADIEIVGSARDDVLLEVESLVAKSDDSTSQLAAITTLVVPVVVGGTMRFESPRNNQRVRLRLEVPGDVSVEVWGSNGGRVFVRDINGPISVENSNAGVTLDGVRGSAIVHASNGSIIGEFLEVAADLPMSFATSNGVIDLTFPADLRAEVLMETDNAGFTSDFVIEPSDGGVDMPLPPDRRRITGRINGGGPLFRLQSSNATILLRRGHVAPRR